MAEPCHRKGQAVFIAAFRRQVEEIVRAQQDIASASVTRIRVENVANLIFVEDADAGKFLDPEVRYFIVVIHLAVRHLLPGGRHVIVVIEVSLEGRYPFDVPSHATFERFDLVQSGPGDHYKCDVPGAQMDEGAVDMIQQE
jgi:hypothetical protein